MLKLYEEKIIDGVLSWRNSSEEHWVQFSPEALTISLMVERTFTRYRETDAQARERRQAVEVAAYLIAERQGFQGNPLDHWLEAERQVK